MIYYVVKENAYYSDEGKVLFISHDEDEARAFMKMVNGRERDSSYSFVEELDTNDALSEFSNNKKYVEYSEVVLEMDCTDGTIEIKSEEIIGYTPEDDNLLITEDNASLDMLDFKFRVDRNKYDDRLEVSATIKCYSATDKIRDFSIVDVVSGLVEDNIESIINDVLKSSNIHFE